MRLLVLLTLLPIPTGPEPAYHNNCLMVDMESTCDSLNVPCSHSATAETAVLLRQLLSLHPNSDSIICDEVTKYPDLELVEPDSGKDTYDSALFSQLPIELHCKIFSYLDQRDLIKIPLVCKRWLDISKTSMFWRRLTINRAFDLEHGCFLSKMPYLAMVEITVNGLMAITNVCLHLAHYCSHLQSLNMSFCKGVDASHIKILVQHCPDLEALNLEGCEDVHDVVIEAVSGWRKLKKLNLSHCKQVTGLGLSFVITRCTLLEELDVLGDTWIDDSTIILLPTYLRETLKSLTLDGENLTDKVYEAVSNCSKLTTLRIVYVEQMSDSGLLALMSLKELQTLEIKQGKELTAAGLCMLFESGNLNKLTHLSLNGCHQLRDDAVEVFAKGCPHLKYLNLAWCWEVTDHGLEAVVNSCCFLIDLDLTGLVLINGICLLLIPETLPRLTFLNVQQCRQVAHDTLKQLLMLKLDLVITDYYGDVVTSEIEIENEDDDLYQTQSNI